jgi:DNA-binding IclR family transcriptional regulator
MLNKKDVCESIINKLQLSGEPITSNELSRQTKLPVSMIRVELNELVRLGTIRSDGRYPCSDRKSVV